MLRNVLPPDLNFVIENLRSHRKRTVDLLKTLSSEEFHGSPGKEIGPVWKQFRHVGRVQENYLLATSTGAVKFSPRAGTYKGGADINAMIEYFEQLDSRLVETLENMDFRKTIDWFGSPTTLTDHFQGLLEHELIHHGQWIMTFKLRNKAFPPSWKCWGV